MSGDRYNKTETSGSWSMNENNEIYWKEITHHMVWDTIFNKWAVNDTTEKQLSPQESPFHCVKNAETSIIIMLEKENLDSPTGKSIYFYDRKINFSVRPDYENVWLTKGDDLRYYMKDLKNYVTARLDPSSNDYVKCSFK